jgi:hypothetical protein
MVNTLDQLKLVAVLLGVPFASMVICWLILMVTMRKTTGELKLFLTPENLVKGTTIVFVVSVTSVLAVIRIIEGSAAGAILSGIVGYTLGTGFKGDKS